MHALLPGLTRANLGNEILAGITLLAIALPLNIGYAQIAGLPPTAGLYALVLPSVLFALLASSRHLVAAPDAAAAALVGSALSGVAVAGTGQYAAMAAAQAIVGGLLFVACAVFKLGFLADFLSKPILIGFVGGLATDILWMPAHTGPSHIGIVVLSDDSLVTRADQYANDIADKLAKRVALEYRVPESVRNRLAVEDLPCAHGKHREEGDDEEVGRKRKDGCRLADTPQVQHHDDEDDERRKGHPV